MKPRTLIGGIAAGVVLLLVFGPIVIKAYNLRRQEAMLKRDIRRLVSRNLVLENELNLLREDPVYVEKVARRTFNKAQEGEIIYRFVEPDDL